jgi:hypothetical protein
MLVCRPATLEQLQTELPAGRLYAVIDACDQSTVPLMAAAVGPERMVSLYEGSAAEAYWDIAPYLAQLDLDLMSWVRDVLWNEPWGFFAVSNGSFEALRRHFRQFLLVNLPDGEEVYFRFYDPRVMQSFLLTCNQDELTRLFGPVSKIVCSNVNSDAVVSYELIRTE